MNYPFFLDWVRRSDLDRATCVSRLRGWVFFPSFVTGTGEQYPYLERTWTITDEFIAEAGRHQEAVNSRDEEGLATEELGRRVLRRLYLRHLLAEAEEFQSSMHGKDQEMRFHDLVDPHIFHHRPTWVKEGLMRKAGFCPPAWSLGPTRPLGFAWATVAGGEC